MDSTTARLFGALDGAMLTPATSTAVDLEREARRLCFTDPALETRYRDEKVMEGLMRARVMAVVAVLYMGAVGFSLMRRVVPIGMWPEFAGWELTIRFLVVAPAWVGLLISTFLAGHRKWATWLYAAVTAWACGALVMRVWWPVINLDMTTAGVDGSVTGDFTAVLLISSIVLPLRRVQVIVTAAVGALPALGWILWKMQPKHAAAAETTALSLLGMSALVIVLAWLRERSDRLIFAQRVSLNRVNAELETSRVELARANADLASVNAEQTVFMGIAAHDLRAPLATVRGYAELLRAGRLREDEAKERALGEIETQSTRMLALVSDYLGAHAAAGRAEPARIERVDVAASARAAVARHAVGAAEKGQRLAVDEAKESPAVFADEARLAQVADNFVGNALKFSPHGSEVRLAVSRRGAAVRLAVRDAGPGIATEEQAGLFRMFGRGSSRPTGGEASHGLGLAVAKRLAESMGGTVGCESELGRGATFWVEVPAAE